MGNGVIILNIKNIIKTLKKLFYVSNQQEIANQYFCETQSYPSNSLLQKKKTINVGKDGGKGECFCTVCGNVYKCGH